MDLVVRLAKALGVDLASCGDGALDPARVTRLPFPPEETSGSQFRDSYLVKEVVRKYPGFDLGVDTTAAAFNSFFEDEAVNASTNDRLLSYSPENRRASRILHVAACKAMEILGQFSWEKWLGGLRFGPGATTRLARKDASVYGKLSGTPEVSRSALPLARTVMSLMPGWAYGHDYDAGIKEVTLALSVCDYDLLRCVPKNAWTGRTIGVTTDMQIYMQLALGYCMRCAMYDAGINLNDQTINQRMAYMASITGKQATVDAKSASNSVTSALVWKYFGDHPHSEKCDPTWFRLLEVLRSTHALVDLPGGSSKLHEYELFSAMGCGFTFEVESLVFWTLAWAVCQDLGIPPEISVYGDDLICPVEAMPLLTEVYSYCGFRFNADKTFANPVPGFRESCGKHYLRGMDVSPFYVDTELDSVSSIVLLANNITRWACNGLGSGHRDGRLLPVWSWVVSHLPDWVLHCGIPYGESDDGLIMDFDEVAPSVVYSEGCKRGMPKTFMGYQCKTFFEGTREMKLAGKPGYVTWLYNQSYTRFTVPPQSPVKEMCKLWWFGASPVKGEPGLHVQLRLGEGSDLFRAFDLVPSRVPPKTKNGLKVSISERRRVVTNWPYLGPWVTDTTLISMSKSDVLLAAALGRGTQIARYGSPDLTPDEPYSPEGETTA
jgi:hypothetical protein